MYTVKIMNEYLHGPVWVYDSDDIAVWKYSLVNDDPIISSLNERAMNIYSGYYEFDSHGQACWFNYEKEKADKQIMLELITKLISRLNEINDGTFLVEDLETERLKNL